MKKCRVVLLGCGSVGTEVAKILLECGVELSSRSGRELELSKILVSNLSVERDPAIPGSLFTTDVASILDEADLVIEVLGGVTLAGLLVERALRLAIPVVTANKALMAQGLEYFLDLASQFGVSIGYEAAVCAAIPILKPIRTSLAGDNVTKILGIVNGTTNYILDQMHVAEVDFVTALGRAKELGYAEADPTADVSGSDAVAKAAILATLAFRNSVGVGDVYCEGLESVSLADVVSAKRDGYVIKMLAICELVVDRDLGGSKISVRVHPTLLSQGHPLAKVGGAYNAVFVEAEFAGSLMFYGSGAGGSATASAILGDVVSVLRESSCGGVLVRDSDVSVAEIAGSKNFEILSLDSIYTRFQLRLEAQDRPGVLAAIASVFAANNISLVTVRQVSSYSGGDLAELVVVTHPTSNLLIRVALESIKNLSEVYRVLSLIRVEVN